MIHQNERSHTHLYTITYFVYVLIIMFVSVYSMCTLSYCSECTLVCYIRVCDSAPYSSLFLSCMHRDLDQHLMPMHLLCNPCAVDYNFYGNFRTLTSDVRHVLSRVGAPEDLYKDRMEHSHVNMRDFLDLYYGRMTMEARKQMKEKMANLTGYTFEAAPSKE